MPAQLSKGGPGRESERETGNGIGCGFQPKLHGLGSGNGNGHGMGMGSVRCESSNHRRGMATTTTLSDISLPCLSIGKKRNLGRGLAICRSTLVGAGPKWHCNKAPDRVC